MIVACIMRKVAKRYSGVCEEKIKHKIVTFILRRILFMLMTA